MSIGANGELHLSSLHYIALPFENLESSCSRLSNTKYILKIGSFYEQE